MGRTSRRKGADFERACVSLLKALGYIDAERNLEYQHSHAGHDIHCSRDHCAEVLRTSYWYAKHRATENEYREWYTRQITSGVVT